ncbi:MAG: MlaA family lipoprotein [Hyphomicrobiales bacterium]
MRGALIVTATEFLTRSICGRYARAFFGAAILAALALAPVPGFAAGGEPVIIIQPIAATPDDEADGLEEISGEEADLPDPLEGVNRVMFKVNDAVDMAVLRPVALVYRTVIPPPLRKGLANFLSNVATPITLTNDILQGNPKRAETTVVRFFLNSVAGFGGVDDIASRAGWERHTEDFGQTLAVYGVQSGPYLMVPIIGPSTPRHLVGRAVDVLANPWTWILWDTSLLESSAPTLATLVSDREFAIETLDTIRESSPDYYATIKNLYYQNRQSEINNGEVDDDDLPEIPDLR